MIKERDVLHGFTVTKIKESKQLNGRLVYMTYEKTGTELLWVDNGADNKLFSITFKTLPSDNTGVFHILEHSVLCGSKKYPVKEPFVDLLKSSMNTFLNAMTFQDKTMYPVSSRNTKDFLNLTSVYLDAVFAPNILTNPNIFYQEGWHIEQDDEGNFSYKGVVFNEMKGALSGRDNIIEESMQTLLFPDTPYGVNSGGDPRFIPDLTYEKFIETYKKFYHPGNARIYLDGNVPLEETLALIESYLSKSGRLSDLPAYKYQKPVSGEKTVYYGCSGIEDEKAQLSFGKIIGSVDNPMEILASEILFNALSDSNEAPFMKAILESGLAQDLEMSVSDDFPQVFFAVDVKDIEPGSEDKIKEILKSVAKKQVENGIDRKALISAINSSEFKLKMTEEPAALMRCIRCMQSWLHGLDPAMYLETEEYFEKLRAMLETDEYEKLLAKIMLDESGLCTLMAVPSETYAAELDEAEKTRLENIKASMSKEEILANKKLNEDLIRWQNTADSDEQKATLPTLPLSELGPDPLWVSTDVNSIGGVEYIYHKLNTNGIAHFNIYFNLSDCDISEITRLSTLSQILSYTQTKNYRTLDLEQEIKTYIGSLMFNVGVVSKLDDRTKATPYLVVNCSVLKNNVLKAYELISEVLHNTLFNKDEVEDLILQADMKEKQTGIVAGHSIGKNCVLSHCSSEDAVNEALNGYTYITWLHGFAAEYDNKFDEYIGILKKAITRSCVRKKMTVSLTCDEKMDISPLINYFEEGEEGPKSNHYEINFAPKLGVKIPAAVGFAVQGSCLKELGEEFDGCMTVASNILSLDYYWNKVRVQGGAYGTGLRIRMNGNIVSYSYRDPSLKRTIDINKGAGEYLRDFCSRREDFEKYIISSVASTEPLLGPQFQGILSDRDYMSGCTLETLRKQRKQMLETSYDKLNRCADILDKFAEKGALCIVGSEDKISEFEDIEVKEL